MTVETVTHRTQMRRWADVPYLLFGRDRRWSRGVRAYEQWRLDEQRHPYFQRGYAAYFLARDAGKPAGRIAAHLPHAGADEGAFGFLAIPDDPTVASALLDAAADWLASEGATSMTGPLSWTTDEEFGVPVGGRTALGITGRPWHPAYYIDQLRIAGLEPTGERRHTYRLPAVPGPLPERSGRIDPPPHAGRYGDSALVFDDIAAVPDVTPVLEEVTLRSAWKAARKVAARAFRTAVVVRCDGDPSVLVPGMRGAAAAAGYDEIVAPWAPPGTPPETTHELFACRLDED